MIHIVLNETKVFAKIKANQAVVFSISKPSLFRVEAIEFVAKKSLNNVKIVVMPSSAPKEVVTIGRVYTYFQISANIPDKDVKEVKIKFQVPKSWLKANEFSEDSVSLYRLVGSKWIKLETKKIGGACLDVFENEKPKTYSENELKAYKKLFAMPNVIVSPHVAGWTVESKRKLSEILLRQIKRMK